MVCIFCQSPNHNYRNCTILYQAKKQQLLKSTTKQDFFGKAPNVFVGKYGYPNIRVGILGTEQYTKHDDPLLWSQERTSIPEIIRLRQEMINSNFMAGIKDFRNRFFEISKEVSLAKRPVDVEINLEKRPRQIISFDTHAAPHGPSVPLKSATIAENPKADTRVEKAADATDLFAGDAVVGLSKKGIDEHYLTRAFSMGNFGLPVERRLVPTRWSITAVDDIIGKSAIEEIKRYAESDCLAFMGGHLGNHYLILFFDSVWQYELFEQFVPQEGSLKGAGVNMETDYESYDGRKSYVEETAGGYYAARMGILERLRASKRQSSVLAIRIITEEYTAPLGVWVVREAVRKTMESKPLAFADRNLMIRYAQSYCRKRFGYDIAPLLKQSLLMKNIFGQTRLSSF